MHMHLQTGSLLPFKEERKECLILLICLNNIAKYQLLKTQNILLIALAYSGISPALMP